MAYISNYRFLYPCQASLNNHRNFPSELIYGLRITFGAMLQSATTNQSQKASTMKHAYQPWVKATVLSPLHTLRFFPDFTPDPGSWCLVAELQSLVQTPSALTFHILYPTATDDPWICKPSIHFNQLFLVSVQVHPPLVTVPFLSSQPGSASSSLSRAPPSYSQQSEYHWSHCTGLKATL